MAREASDAEAIDDGAEGALARAVGVDLDLRALEEACKRPGTAVIFDFRATPLT